MHEAIVEESSADPAVTALDLPTPMPDVFDFHNVKRDLFDLEKDITGQPLMCSSPKRRPAIPLERLPSWPPAVDTSALHSGVIQTNVAAGSRSGRVVHETAPQYNLPMSAVYNPTACGCFFNKQAIVHMLGLCRFAKFRSKCSYHGSHGGGKRKKVTSKKKGFELDYGFLERNHMRIYDINRGLHSHKQNAKNSHVCTDAGVLAESMRKRTMSMESTSTLRKSRPVRRSVSRQSLGTNASALARLKQSIRVHKNTRYKDHKHKVLSGTSRPGT